LKSFGFWTEFLISEIEVPHKNAVQITEGRIEVVRAHKGQVVFQKVY
jgi:hypothetical protein